MSLYKKYKRKLEKWFKKKAKQKVIDMAWDLAEGPIEDMLTGIQDQMSKWLYEEHQVPRKLSSQAFWIGVDKLDDNIPIELDDQTPGK